MYIVKMTAKDWNRFAKAMMVLAILPLIIAGIFAVRTHLFLQHAVAAKAKVIELVKKATQNGTYYAPVFTFTDTNGKEEKVYSKVSSYPPIANVGDEIDILYDRGDPRNAKENQFIILWGFSVVPAGLGAFYFILFWAVAFFTGRMMKNSGQHLETTKLPPPMP